MIVQMLYIDPSSLLKTFWVETETDAVMHALAQETTVVISVLAELETLTQLKAGFLAGEYTRARWRHWTWLRGIDLAF